MMFFYRFYKVTQIHILRKRTTWSHRFGHRRFASYRIARIVAPSACESNFMAAFGVVRITLSFVHYALIQRVLFTVSTNRNKQRFI